jgi:hypothetical protein
VNRKLNFAPVSSAQSGLLRFASAWFVFNGAVFALLVVAVIVRSVLSHPRPEPTILFFFDILIPATAAAGIVWTGFLLARGSRVGGYVAFGLILLPIVAAALTRQPLDMFQIAFAILGVIVLALVWHELK